jgi:hypothetical protein
MIILAAYEKQSCNINEEFSAKVNRHQEGEGNNKTSTGRGGNDYYTQPL